MVLPPSSMRIDNPRSTSTQPSRASWSASMPLSMTATRTPLPVAPPHAHSGDRSASVATPGRRKTVESLEYAGRGSRGRSGMEQALYQSGDDGVTAGVGDRQPPQVADQLG